MLDGLQDPEIVDGACMLDPTDLLSEVFRDYRHPKNIHVIIQTFNNGELTLLSDEP